MHILHVVPYYEQAWAYGGIPRLATTMTRALAGRGHRVTVCTTDARDDRTRATGTPNRHGIDVRMFRNASNALAYHLQFFTPIGFRTYVRRAARTFDVAHIHACHNLPGVVAAAELSRAGVPYVVSPNGTARPIERRIVAKQLFARTAGRRMLVDAARVIAVSHAERRDLLALGLDDTAIVRIPNPIDETESIVADPASFRAAIGVGSGPLILYLGKLTPRKGVVELVRAFAALDAPDTTLVIAGNDMGAGREIRSHVRRLTLEGRVTFAGLLTGAERYDALAAADVVVYPSRDEIFGLVPLEALMCGTPVIVCNDSGCGEVISATGGGQLVAPGDIAGLAQAIKRVLTDRGHWHDRARVAAGVARQLFGSDVVCSQLETLYSQVLAESTPAGMQRA